jgi:kynurenine formamidase
MTRKLIDVSHDIEAGMITYPGLPGPEVSDHLSREASRGKYAPGTTFQIAKIDMIANTGTYLDSPFHRFGDREDLGMLPLDAVADLAGLVIDASSRRGRSIGPDVFAGYSLSGKAVLIKTLWDRHWRTPQYGAGHPYLTRAAVDLLVAARVALVGIDSLNIDDTDDGTRPAHTFLLEAGIPIVEHLCRLDELPQTGFRFHCAPAKFRGVGSFPVRAYAVVEQ